jgi:hypothetical protein
VDFVVDNMRKTIDTSSAAKDNQILTFPLQGTLRWKLPIQAADLISSLLVILTCIFISSYYSQILPGDTLSLFRVSRRKLDAAFIVLFIILLGLPVLNFQGDLREFDKRFWMRETILRSWANFRFHVLGDRLFNAMIVGKDNWLIYTGEMSLDDYQSVLPVTDQDLAVIQRKLDGLNRRLAAKGITFLFVVTPNKNTIYPEYVPAEIPVLEKQSLLDRLVEYQKQNGEVQVLDLRPALLAARNERPVYYSTDTHWNDFGAFVGYQEILRTLQKNHPDLIPHSYDDYQEIRNRSWIGDMSHNLGQINIAEDTIQLEPKFNRRIYTWNAKGYEANSVVTTVQPVSSLPKLVMFHDSFAIALIPFLSDHFHTATYLAKAQVDEKFIDAEQPDIVIFEITERSISFLKNLVLPE